LADFLSDDKIARENRPSDIGLRLLYEADDTAVKWLADMATNSLAKKVKNATVVYVYLVGEFCIYLVLCLLSCGKVQEVNGSKTGVCFAVVIGLQDSLSSSSSSAAAAADCQCVCDWLHAWVVSRQLQDFLSLRQQLIKVYVLS